jgi:hypothetical protein
MIYPLSKDLINLLKSYKMVVGPHLTGEITQVVLIEL